MESLSEITLMIVQLTVMEGRTGQWGRGSEFAYSYIFMERLVFLMKSNLEVFCIHTRIHTRIHTHAPQH